VVRRRCRRPIQVQLIIIIILNLIPNMEDIHLRSLVVILSLVQNGEVTNSPSLEVVHLPFLVEMEYRLSLALLRSLALLLSLVLLLSPMVDTRDRPVVAMKRLSDLHTLVDIILTVGTDLLVDIMHLRDLQGSLIRAATEVPVILNSLELIHLQGLSTTLITQTVITLPIKVVGGES